MDRSERAPESELPFRPPFFYGWIIVAISAVTLFFSGPGQTHSVSVFIDSYIEEFGWSRSVVSGMYSLGTLGAGLLMGAVGSLFDRHGHRFMTTLVAALLGAAAIWMSRASRIPMLLAGFFLIRLLGQSSMSLSSTTLVPQWFIRRRGRALSVVSLGGVASSAALPPLNTWIIQNYGWRMGWTAWAVLLWIVMVPLGYLLIRDRPEEVGLRPEGEETAVLTTMEEGVELEVAWTVKEAIGTRCFWLLLFCMMIPSAIGTGLVFHQVSIMGEAGLGPEVAASVLSLMAVVRLPVVFFAGHIADRLPVRYLLAVGLGLLFLGLVVQLNISSVQTAMAYGALLGVMMAFLSIVGGVIWPEYFGRRYLGGIRGVAMMAMVAGSAAGPLPFGFAYDLFGGYREILVISMIFPVLGMVAAMLATPPRK